MEYLTALQQTAAAPPQRLVAQRLLQPEMVHQTQSHQDQDLALALKSDPCVLEQKAVGARIYKQRC